MAASSKGLVDAQRHRKALVAAALHWEGDSDDDPDAPDERRRALRAAALVTGEGSGAILDLWHDSRAQPWRLHLAREARRLSACGASSVVLRSPEGEWKVTPCGCGGRGCTVCARARSARTDYRLRPVFEAATSDGAEIRHVTLTQRADIAEGGLVTPLEVRRYGWRGTVADEGVVARSVGGESIGEAYHRLRGSLRTIRKNGATRDAWRTFLGGYIEGIEWTGRDPGGPACPRCMASATDRGGRPLRCRCCGAKTTFGVEPGAPRWHAHVHLLVVTPRELPKDFVNARIREWAKHVGGHVGANKVRLVQPDRIREVVKYPFKPAALTSAQRIEVMAYMRGLRPHHIGGPFHAASKLHTAEPWARWWEARRDPPRFRRLHHIDPEVGVPEVWRGSPADGVRRWALRTEDGWETWEADAAPFAGLLQQADPDAAEPTPEPGSDLSAELFGGEDA